MREDSERTESLPSSCINQVCLRDKILLEVPDHPGDAQPEPINLKKLKEKQHLSVQDYRGFILATLIGLVCLCINF